MSSVTRRWISLLVGFIAFSDSTMSDASTSFEIVETATSLGHPAHALEVGESITLGIRINGGRQVYGLGASAWHYDESVIDFQNGRAVSSINHEFCVASAGCVGSRIENIAAGDLRESAYGGGGNRVQLFNGVGLNLTNGNPLDPGLDGVVGGNDAQIRITFIATGVGTSTIRIGSGYPRDGEFLPGGFDPHILTIFPVTVIPEPGTALLLGLGLAALAATPTRRDGDWRAR